MELQEQTLREIAAGWEEGRWSAEEIVDTEYGRLQVDDTYNAFLALQDEEALQERAETLDRLHELEEPVGPLAGAPVAIKDNICTETMPTTAGSGILEGFRPPYTATAVRRLREAGALVVGKTNLDEFAMGSSNENSNFGPVRNPRAPDRTPGGSSGGSAAAVAAGLCAGALGSDTGGSIRQPAAHCGIVGLKPTYGRVSRYGLVAFASSLDQIGPMARTVDDAAALLGSIAGRDSRDATSLERSAPSPSRVEPARAEDLTVGIPEEYFGGEVDSVVEEQVRAAIRELEEAGAELVEVSLPHTEYAVAAYYLVATAEASSNLARYDGVRYGLRAEADDLEAMYERSRTEGFGDEVKRRIMLGTYVLSAGYYDDYYEKAQKVRTLVRRDFAHAFEDVDVLATPTTPTTPFELGEKVDDPLQMYLQDVFTTPCNLAGLPAMSLPCGESPEGLPVGLQLVGGEMQERKLLRVGRLVEQLV